MEKGTVYRPKITKISDSGNVGKVNYLIYSAQGPSKGYDIIQVQEGTDPSFLWDVQSRENILDDELTKYGDFDVLTWAVCHGQTGTWKLEIEPYETILAKQPLNSAFKIDCQTLGAVITYSIERIETTPVSDFNGYAQEPPPAVTMPVSADIPYTQDAIIPLLSDDEAKSMNGYHWGIKAVATLNGAQETAYAVVDRSVLQFTTPPLFFQEDSLINFHQLIVHGGDSK